VCPCPDKHGGETRTTIGEWLADRQIASCAGRVQVVTCVPTHRDPILYESSRTYVRQTQQERVGGDVRELYMTIATCVLGMLIAANDKLCTNQQGAENGVPCRRTSQVANEDYQAIQYAGTRAWYLLRHNERGTLDSDDSATPALPAGALTAVLLPRIAGSRSAA
jgi:hypothetical protein